MQLYLYRNLLFVCKKFGFCGFCTWYNVALDITSRLSSFVARLTARKEIIHIICTQKDGKITYYDLREGSHHDARRGRECERCIGWGGAHFFMRIGRNSW
jgi:hypothetical protein